MPQVKKIQTILGSMQFFRKARKRSCEKLYLQFFQYLPMESKSKLLNLSLPTQAHSVIPVDLDWHKTFLLPTHCPPFQPREQTHTWTIGRSLFVWMVLCKKVTWTLEFDVNLKKESWKEFSHINLSRVVFKREIIKYGNCEKHIKNVINRGTW